VKWPVAVDEKQGPHDETEFDLRECVIDAARVIAPRAHAKGLELACDTADEIPARTVGDPMRLRQVIVNLVGNAVKFTSKSEIVVRAELVPDTAGEPTGAAGSEHGAVADYRWTIAISVRDTGVGIAPEKQAVVFQPFSQADGSTTRKFGGTGLGLTISKQLVKMMGGRIWLESVLGEGTTVHFTARLGRVAETCAEPGLRTDADLVGRTALAVDDNATNRLILQRQLSGLGLRPVVVASAELALLELERFDGRCRNNITSVR
jgi:two-component system sensor histidine kinase/response regulator